MSQTVCAGWNDGLVHTDVRILQDDGKDDGLLSHGICPDCHWYFRATHGLDEPLACECLEHACDPPKAQTERYLVEGGYRLYRLCAQCTALGHMACRPEVIP